MISIEIFAIRRQLPSMRNLQLAFAACLQVRSNPLFPSLSLSFRIGEISTVMERFETR